MLSANLNNLSLIPFASPKLLEIIEKAKAFLAEKPELGRYELEGDQLFIQVIEGTSGPVSEHKSEFHNNYMDIQVLLSGSEKIGWGHMPAGEVTEDYLAEKDLAFTAGIVDEKFIEMAANDFVVFYPGELHRPLCESKAGPKLCRKAIVKVHRDYLG
ncbi:YhcH/YjgK/YiaL family protein [Polycladidibacter hongkongensis]|uniref:YhcH/YjgK/YiaL family protein n=1 Tax=Polycladidibacter hongkongensis TaxID=1647556 RepID=UPI00082D55FB|nr:YhcH/YjgK/YiaL family protein [Pseudovibrio hongkongensis]